MHPFTPQDIANSGLSGAAGVDQAWLGDCVFEACAAAVATTATGQAAISLAIEQNADQSYAVTFPGRPQDPVPVGLSSLSAQTNVAPALGSLNSSLFLAWTAAVNGNLNVAQVNPGAGGGFIRQVYLGEASANNPALASFNGLLYLAWTGVGNNQLNVNYSADNGATFAGKATAADASLQGPALCQINGNLLMAWTASANNQINLSKVNVAGNAVTGFSGKVSLVDTTPYSPALAALNNVLFLAWTSAGSGALNIALSLDNGASFVSKYVSAQSSAAAPALTVQNGALLVAWKGNGNDALNVGQVLLSGNTITGIGNVVKLADASDHSPALASNGTLFLAWKGSGNPELNVESSTDGGRTFINKFTVPTASDSATWADVLETALFISDPDFANGANLPPGATGAAGGGATEPAQYAMYLLTGSLATNCPTSSANVGTVGTVISQALAAGQPVAAYCSNDDNGALVSGHEWTVMACDPAARTITLRNPWGNFHVAGTSKNGVNYLGNAEVSMTLQLFVQFYAGVDIGYTPGLIGQVVLADASTNSPALATLNGRLYLAWTGVGNNQLNVSCSTDWGVSFEGKAASADTSPQAPAICANNGNLFIAWTATGNQQLNVSKVAVLGGTVNGYYGKVTLAEASSCSPALASFNGLLYLAWTGVGNKELNIAVSLDNGASFVNKFVSQLTSISAPSLAVHNGVLYIAWTDSGNGGLNVGQVLLSGNTITGIGNVVKLADASDHSPVLASNGTLYLAWKGKGNTTLNIEKSTNGGVGFSNKYMSNQQSNAAPALVGLDGSVFLAWTDVGNNKLHVARVSG